MYGKRGYRGTCMLYPPHGKGRRHSAFCLTTTTTPPVVHMASMTGRKVLVERGSVLRAYWSLNEIMVRSGLNKKVQCRVYNLAFIELD